MDFFFKHEYKAFIQYIPDVKQIKENKVNMVTAVGRDSDDAHYVQSTRALASKLCCKCIEFPGQHDVSFYMPQEFSTPLGVRWNRSMTGKTMNNKQNLPSDIHIKRMETRLEGSCCSKDLVLYILDVK